MNSEIDEYLSKVKKWRAEIEELRRIILDCGLSEELKWRSPCYVFEKNNIAIIGAFKEYCALSFFKGVLLQDTDSILQAPGENSQSVRLVKFTNIQDIRDAETILKNYIYEAIEVEKAGLKVDFKEKEELIYPEELQIKFNKNADLKTAFSTLTPGRQRAYNLYFTAAKQSKTRTSRIESCVQKIFARKGLNDCTCGLSKRMPNCDGSHKKI